MSEWQEKVSAIVKQTETNLDRTKVRLWRLKSFLLKPVSCQGLDLPILVHFILMVVW